MKRNLYCIATALIMATLLSGCGVFTHYTTRVAPVRDTLRAGDVKNAEALLMQNKTTSETDKLAYLLEEGMLEHTGGEFEGSNQTFFEAARNIDDRDMRARLSLGKSLEQFGSVLVNEKTMAYEAEGYERVFMHTVQAMNFLLLGDKEGARVEIRKAYNDAQVVEELNRKKLEKVEDKLADENNQGKNLNQDAILSSARDKMLKDPEFSALQSEALNVKNAYENAFSYYLSSLVYEMNGEYNDAYIDCKKAHELRPEFKPAQEDLIRLAGLVGFREDKESWIAKFGREPKRPEDAGDLILVLQNGAAPEKKQIWIPIPIPKVGIQSFAFPVYKPVPYKAAGVQMCSAGEEYCETQLLVNMTGLAIRNFLDRVPELVLRTAIRFAIKAVATHQLKKEAGAAGMIVGSVLTAVTEQADLRSWLLMPAQVQMERYPMTPGEHTLNVNLVDRAGHTIDSREVTVKIEKGKMTFVNMRGIDTFVGDIQVAPPQ